MRLLIAPMLLSGFVQLLLVETAGYSSLEEFIEHAMEKDLARLEEAGSKEDLIKKLKGLGYLE